MSSFPDPTHWCVFLETVFRLFWRRLCVFLRLETLNSETATSQTRPVALDPTSTKKCCFHGGGRLGRLPRASSWRGRQQCFANIVSTFFLRMPVLGAFTKLRKVTVGFAMSVHPSVCPHGTTRLPLDGFSSNLMCARFSKLCWENSSFIETWQE